MPRGYSESDPAAEWLRFKNWDVFYSIPDSELSSTADFDRLIRSLVLKMEPLRLFLLEAATLRRTEKQAMEDFYCCQSQ